MVDTKEKAKVVYFGTPEFAVPALQLLAESDAIDLIGVVTQPDKPAGRGLRLTAPPVKVAAEAHQIPVFQPKSIKSIELISSDNEKLLQGQKSNTELVAFLNEQERIDAFVCVAYGKFIPNALLEFTKCGMINIHPSLLPRWRGPGPLQQALFAGDSRTGVTLMEIDEGMDTGPIFSALDFEIKERETLGTLHDTLARLGAELLLKELPKIISGALKAEPQTEEAMTYAAKWEVEDCIIKWQEDADITRRRINTCTPIPGARTQLAGELVKLFSAQKAEDQNFPDVSAGTVVEFNREELIVAAGSGEYLSIEQIQFPGKKRLTVPELHNGRKISVGDTFTNYSIESN